MIQRILSVIKRIAGMPDYRRYVEHMRTCHPERPVPSEREFFDQFLARRYGGGTSRCC